MAVAPAGSAAASSAVSQHKSAIALGEFLRVLRDCHKFSFLFATVRLKPPDDRQVRTASLYIHKQMLEDHRRSERRAHHQVSESESIRAEVRSSDDGLQLARLTLLDRFSRIAFVNIVIAGILVGLLWQFLSSELLLIWFTLLTGTIAGRYLLSWRYRHTNGQHIVPARWLLFFSLGAALTGTLWGCLALSVPLLESFSIHALIALVLAGVSAGALGSFAAHLPAFYLFAGPAILPLAVTCLLERTPLYLALGVMILIFGATIAILAREFNRTLVENIDLRIRNQRAAQRLEAAYNAQLAANEVKSRFLANMSHELRTPLNAVVGFSELLRNEVHGPLGHALYKDFVANIHDAGRSMLTLVTDLLEMTRIGAEQVGVQKRRVELSSLIASVVKLLKMEIRTAAVDVVCTLDPKTPALWADDSRLHRVLFNLLSNAVKFTPAGGQVTISVQWDARTGTTAVTVSDTGIGIAPEHLQKVLKPFAQVEDEPLRAHGGVGVGLPLAKALIEEHGGSFFISSIPGKGTTVGFTLPANDAVGAAQPSDGPRV